ncbi:hypothetical protein G7Y89_g4542 [Cudoniella acicularis]|uniref:Uncharacterized protein n=1 Tax=Cudoniella acicularis TaxID=354080 RepID=A0A8H4RP88_9HELO|nr:hypothetical protein G7Y89_g4542 [Cudoniella acicularis]
MRTNTLTTSFFLLPISISISALQIPSVFAPFYEPHIDSLLTSNETIIPDTNELLKRDGNCPVNYNSCSTLAANDGAACCTQGSVCTRDKANNIACCNIGATCTGTINQGTPAATTTTSGGGAVFGTTTTAATTTTAGTTATITNAASVVPNAYFPFPYISTTYVNSAACNSAFQACQANYAACTADLQGGSSGFAVTIVAPQGGITSELGGLLQSSE